MQRVASAALAVVEASTVRVEALQAETAQVQRLLLPVEEVLRLLAISRTTYVRERKRGHLYTVNVGRRVYVPYGVLQAYVRHLCEQHGIPAELAG